MAEGPGRCLHNCLLPVMPASPLLSVDPSLQSDCTIPRSPGYAEEWTELEKLPHEHSIPQEEHASWDGLDDEWREVPTYTHEEIEREIDRWLPTVQNGISPCFSNDKSQMLLDQLDPTNSLAQTPASPSESEETAATATTPACVYKIRQFRPRSPPSPPPSEARVATGNRSMSQCGGGVVEGFDGSCAEEMDTVTDRLLCTDELANPTFPVTIKAVNTITSSATVSTSTPSTPAKETVVPEDGDIESHHNSSKCAERLPSLGDSGCSKKCSPEPGSSAQVDASSDICHLSSVIRLRNIQSPSLTTFSSAQQWSTNKIESDEDINQESVRKRQKLDQLPESEVDPKIGFMFGKDAVLDDIHREDAPNEISLVGEDSVTDIPVKPSSSQASRAQQTHVAAAPETKSTATAPADGCHCEIATTDSDSAEHANAENVPGHIGDACVHDASSANRSADNMQDVDEPNGEKWVENVPNEDTLSDNNAVEDASAECTSTDTAHLQQSLERGSAKFSEIDAVVVETISARESIFAESTAFAVKEQDSGGTVDIQKMGHARPSVELEKANSNTLRSSERKDSNTELLSSLEIATFDCHRENDEDKTMIPLDDNRDPEPTILGNSNIGEMAIQAGGTTSGTDIEDKPDEMHVEILSHNHELAQNPVADADDIIGVAISFEIGDEKPMKLAEPKGRFESKHEIQEVNSVEVETNAATDDPRKSIILCLKDDEAVEAAVQSEIGKSDAGPLTQSQPTSAPPDTTPQPDFVKSSTYAPNGSTKTPAPIETQEPLSFPYCGSYSQPREVETQERVVTTSVSPTPQPSCSPTEATPVSCESKPRIILKLPMKSENLDLDKSQASQSTGGSNPTRESEHSYELTDEQASTLLQCTERLKLDIDAYGEEGLEDPHILYDQMKQLKVVLTTLVKNHVSSQSSFTLQSHTSGNASPDPQHRKATTSSFSETSGLSSVPSTPGSAIQQTYTPSNASHQAQQIDTVQSLRHEAETTYGKRTTRSESHTSDRAAPAWLSGVHRINAASSEVVMKQEQDQASPGSTQVETGEGKEHNATSISQNRKQKQKQHVSPSIVPYVPTRQTRKAAEKQDGPGSNPPASGNQTPRASNKANGTKHPAAAHSRTSKQHNLRREPKKPNDMTKDSTAAPATSPAPGRTRRSATPRISGQTSSHVLGKRKSRDSEAMSEEDVVGRAEERESAREGSVARRTRSWCGA